MKKVVLFLSIFLPIAVFGQGIFTKPNNSFGTISNRQSIDSTLYIPTQCGAPTDTNSLHSPKGGQKLLKTAVIFDTCGHHFYAWDPSLVVWLRIDSGGGGSFDTTTIMRLIGTKADTSSVNTLIAIISGLMTNFGGAPGFRIGPAASLPAASTKPTGLVYIASDSGWQKLDTGSGGTAGWKLINGSPNPAVVDSPIVAGFGIIIPVTGTKRTVLTDTTISYLPYNVVTGLNDKLVGSGNSNGVGYPRNIDSSYPTETYNRLGGGAAGWTLDVLGIPSQTTAQMITGDPSRVDTAFDGTKAENYLAAWEMENHIFIDGVSAATAQTAMNIYYTARNGVGWRTIGATALPRADGSNNFDSLQTARTDSANKLLIASHTSNLFIDFTHDPWLSNNMSRAGYLSDHTHMNASGTQEMADSFALAIKKDLGQPAIPIPAHPIFSGGQVTDRSIIIGSSTGYGTSIMGGGIPALDVTGYGGLNYVGRKVVEGNGVNNVGFWMLPSFWNPNGFTGSTNYDFGINSESQWIDTKGNKIALFNPEGTIMNVGLGIDIFANLQPGQTTYFFNGAFGTHAFQGATPGSFNAMYGPFSSDVHTSSGNTFLQAGLTVPAIGNDNTYLGGQGSIASGTTGSTTVGYGNTQGANYSIVVGNSNVISGTSTHTGGSIAIGFNQNDAGFRGIFIGNLESSIYGNLPTADGQCIIGDIYNGSGYKAINTFLFGGNQAFNSTIQSSFGGILMSPPDVAGGGSNTNLSAAAEVFQFKGSLATGNAPSGAIVFSTGQKGSSGTTQQSKVEVLRIDGDQTVDIGQPATHPYGTNINTSVGINKDSASQIAPVSATQLLVINTTTNKINRIPLGGILATNDLTAQSAAVATVTSYAVPGSGGFNTFRVGGYLTVTAVSVDVIQLQVTYTDETSTSRTQSFFVQGATTGISVTGANGYSPLDVRVKQGTTITVSTVLTTGAGTITYDVGASIAQLY